MENRVSIFIITIIGALILGVLIGYFSHSGIEDLGDRMKHLTLNVHFLACIDYISDVRWF